MSARTGRKKIRGGLTGMKELKINGAERRREGRTAAEEDQVRGTWKAAHLHIPATA